MSNKARNILLGISLLVLSGQSFANWEQDCKTMDQVLSSVAKSSGGICSAFNSFVSEVNMYAPPNPCADKDQLNTYHLGERADCQTSGGSPGGSSGGGAANQNLSAPPPVDNSGGVWAN